MKAALFFATNRLFRKNYRSLQFVEEQIVERGIRAVFVKSGVDTADVKKWRSLLNMHAMMDEFVVTTNVDHIRAAHEGLLEKSLVFGTVSFGYRGEVIPGTLTRRGRPRKSLAVDDVAADHVRKVFEWFVTDRLSILAIVRRLKADPVVPPPPKSPNRVWTRQAVMRVLKNARYRGCWRYRVTETVWISSKDYARQVNRTAPLKSVHLETLRLVGDDVWFTAQSLFEREAAKMVGRKPRDGDSATRPRVLNGLFACAAHDRILYVGGPHGGSMFCKDCQAVSAGERPLFSLLPRVVALQKTCAALADLIRQDSDLVQRVVASCQRHAENEQAPDPAQVTVLTTRLAKLDHRIQFVLRNPGETDRDTAESTALVKQLRHERSSVQAESDAVSTMAARVIVIPTDEEVLRLLDSLVEVLMKAGAGAEEQAGRVRQLIDLLTGGRIELVQQGERRAKRGWLQGRFPNRVLAGVTHQLTGVHVSPDGSEPCEVVIDYRREPEALPVSVVAEVVSLYEAGALVKEIARRVQLNRNRVTQILEHWHAQQNRECPDGRQRRASLTRKHLRPPLYQEIAERVKQLADEGQLFDGIANALDVDRNTVTAAWKFWHDSRGLAVPDGRNRRKSLPRSSRPRTDSD